MSNFEVIDAGNGKFIKAWKRGVQFEDKAVAQLKNAAQLPFVRPYIAAMPDTHWGMGATVGSVIPAEDAIIPAAVGVDIGCGMIAVRTNLKNGPSIDGEWLDGAFCAISKAVPHGRTNNGGPGDRGAWHNVPEDIQTVWDDKFFEEVTGEVKWKPGQAAGIYFPKATPFTRHPGALSKNAVKQLGTLGTGNHFIEVCADEDGDIWVVIHSGSRGFGNRIGSYFTRLAKEQCAAWHVQLPDPDLAYFPRHTQEFSDYVQALRVAQKFAWINRLIMMGRTLKAIGAESGEPLANQADATVHCHHNYMSEERHFGKAVLLTRKGAVSAAKGELVIIPGSMGARTYIAVGLGSRDSFHSCSHGAGRAMSRTAAKQKFTVADHEAATEGVVCHKGAEVLDETPGAYKDIESVMAAQSDLVTPIFRLRQLVCIKGLGE